jgi:hypothetical protein
VTISARLAVVLAAVVGVGGARTPVAAHRQLGIDPSVPVRLLLSQPRYAPGTHGRVYVEIGRDGYLVVLHAQPDGHIQVAFPLDPGGDAAVRAGDSMEVHGRGGRDAFTVEDSSGSGTWYAAISTTPFRFDSIAVSGHWDYRMVPHVADPRDAERDLTTFVQGIATSPFDYDIVEYHISLYAYAGAPGYRVPSPPPPPPPPDDPWWFPTPWGGGWGWPPWWPKPGPGPGPFYDRSVGSAGDLAPRSAAPAAGDRGDGRGSPPVIDAPSELSGRSHR